MSITLNTEPVNLEFVKDIIHLEAESDNYFSASGVKHVLTLSFTNKASIGDEMTLGVDGTDYVFSCKASDDGTGLWMPEGSGTRAEWVEAFVEAIKHNNFFYQNYTITYEGGDVMKFEARDYGDVWNISASSSDITWTVSTNTSGVDQTTNENFEIIMQVYLEESFSVNANKDLFIQIAELTLTPDSNEQAIFYLQKVLEPYLDKVSAPEIGATSLGSVSGILKNYFYKYGEKYGDPATYKAIYDGDVKKVIQGGQLWKSKQDNTALDLLTGSSAIFLNWHPGSKKVTPDQDNFLYYLHASVYDWFDVILTPYTQDGSALALTNDILFEKDKASQYTLWSIPLGFDDVIAPFIDAQLASASETVIYYDIKVQERNDNSTSASGDDVTADVTEERRFYLDRRFHRFSYHFVFMNSFGVYENLVIHGKKTRIQAYSRSEYQKFIDHDYDPESPQIEMDNSYMKKFRIGFRAQNEDESNWITEFLNSMDVREVIDGKYHPLKITSSSAQVHKDDETLHNYMIELESTYTENVYSNA